jgi:hypothetical protein
MGHMLMTMLLLTMAAVEGTPGGVPLLAFVSRAGFGATNKGGATDNRGRSTVVGVPPLSPTIPAFRTHEERSQLHVHHGIPKLFRWLVDLYPIVLESVGEGLSGSNAMAVDNFYLDMNGIIHTCTHTNNDKLVTLNEREMFQRIFSYTDRLYKLVRPSRLMFLAVDGVAPRAKMNQQRSRRFRSSKEREALPSRSTLKPAICFLNPPMPNNTWLAGMRQFSKYSWHHCSPLMKFDGSLKS